MFVALILINKSYCSSLSRRWPASRRGELGKAGVCENELLDSTRHFPSRTIKLESSFRLFGERECDNVYGMYNPHEIEPKWQKYWDEQKLHLTLEKTDKPKLYVLDMFPYPSGDGLHVGHSRIYTASDVYSRMKRMQGFNVLHPMGWDAFGLPTENYAIKTGQHPKVTTAKNIANIKRQMQIQGFSYDWTREINTTDPKYYKWTQWIFIKLFEKGLAYEANVPINWCPKDKTGLANEEVVNGKCDRCGTIVERKQMRQWMLKITNYADALLTDLNDLKWPAKIKTMQKNWIGRSEGASIRFLLESKPDEYIEAFTTRPDTLFGATYMVLAPEHQMVDEITRESHRAEVNNYVKRAANKSDLERTELQKVKTGVFTGSYAINPVNGAKLPIWVADYVLGSYGTGAIMAVPAHDQRDFEFATKYNLPIITVIKSSTLKSSDSENKIYVDDGELINSSNYNGKSSKEARKLIVTDLQRKGLAEAKVEYRLRDWVFSRQRYWGEPIPLIHCQKCGIQAVPEKDLPVLLPETDRYQPTDSGESPLASIDEWVNTKCPKCAGSAKRETNTMPQWAGSSWYYLRFIDPQNQQTLAGKELLKKWLPVDVYVGGAEHAVLHLLYARFWHKFLADIDAVPYPEPFTRLESVGLILAKAYKDVQGRYVHYDNVVIDGEMAFHRATLEPLTFEVEKMSKSKGNVISPDFVIEKYGADTLRVYSMFLGPWGEMNAFDLGGIPGVSRFLNKVESLSRLVVSNKVDEKYRMLEAASIISITDDIEKFRFNTAVSQLMILTNYLSGQKSIFKSSLEILIKLLSPFAPHLAEEMWYELGHRTSIFVTNWPKADANDALDQNVEFVVQINGKVRSKFTTSRDLKDDEIIELAKSSQMVQKYLNNTTVKQVIVVPNRLVNFVI